MSTDQKTFWRGEHLHLGRIWVGYVSRIVPEGWRDWPMYRDPPVSDMPEYMRANREGQRKHHERNDAKPWRAWLSSSEDGEAVGYYATEQEARAALEAAVS